jgi:hypothetical protein
MLPPYAVWDRLILLGRQRLPLALQRQYLIRHQIFQLPESLAGLSFGQWDKAYL